MPTPLAPVNNNPKPVDLPREFDVHTMPAKFLTLRPSLGVSGHSSGLKKNIITGLILVVVIGAAMALATWFFLKSVKKDTPVVDNQPAASIPANTLNQEPPTTVATTTDESALGYLTDVSQWQTYTDPAYQYVLKYPATWMLTSSALPSAPSAISSSSLKGVDGLGAVDLSIFDNPNELTLADWLGTAFGLDSIDCGFYKLNNQDSCRYDHATGDSFTIFTLYDGRFYSLKFTLSDRSTIAEVYNQILINWQFPPVTAAPEETEPGLDNTPAIDSDSDGLTDVEEALYQTDKNNPDTDGDSYRDGLEVASLYNPTVPGSARLFDSDQVKTFVNNYFHYSLLYPASWTKKETPNSVIFQDQTGEFIQVLIETNSKGYQDVGSWYQGALNLDPSSLAAITINNTQPAMVTPDRKNIYFIFGDNIYSLIYNQSLRQYGNFTTTFELVIKSLQLMPLD